MFTIRDKKSVCSDQKFTRVKKNYLSSARLAQYIFHAWTFPPLSLKMLQYCSTYSAATQCCSVITILFLASGIDHHINYKNGAHPKHFWTSWFFQWVNLLWGGSLISPRLTYPLQCCSIALLKCFTPTPCSAAVLQCYSVAVPQRSSAPVLQYCSTEVSYPPPCSAALLQCWSVLPTPLAVLLRCIAAVLQCCSAAVLQCCNAAYLRCCSVLLISISACGIRHPRNYKNRAHPRNFNSRVDPIFSISREWGVFIMMHPGHPRVCGPGAGGDEPGIQQQPGTHDHQATLYRGSYDGWHCQLSIFIDNILNNEGKRRVPPAHCRHSRPSGGFYGQPTLRNSLGQHNRLWKHCQCGG